jgi:hypothetical protein
MAQNDDVQAPEDESGSVLADTQAGFVPAPAVPVDDAPEAGERRPASAAAPPPGGGDNGPLRAAWTWLTTGVWAALAWLGLALATWVAMSQIGSIVAEVTPTGQYPVSALTGIGQLGAITTAPHAPLMAWDQAGVHFPALRTWLWTCVGMDLLFIAGLVMLAVTIMKNRPRVTVARWLIAVVAACYGAEALLGAIALGLAQADRKGDGGQDVWAWPLHIATELKWASVIVLAGWIVYRVHESYTCFKDSRAPMTRRVGIYADLRRLVQAFEVQRFSVVVVLLLGLIAIGPPLSGTLEQMPDVQRAWLSSGRYAGWSQLLLAALAQVLLAVMLASLGRMRTVRAMVKFADRDDNRRGDPQLLVWIGIALSLPALAGVLTAAGAARVSWARVAAFSAILLIFALASVGIDKADSRRRQRNRAQLAPYSGRALPARDLRMAGIAGLAGDALAVMVVAVTPLGAVRSFMAPALVMGGLPVAALAVGMIGAAAVPLACGLLASRYPPDVQEDQQENEEEPAPDDAQPAAKQKTTRATRRERDRHLAGRALYIRVLLLTGAAFVLTDLWLIIAPLNATHVLGVLATAVIAIGSLATLLGTLAFLVQTRRPLSIFRSLRLNVTPVLTIIMIIAVAGGIFDSSSSLHQVSGPVAAGQAPRPTLATALARWLHSPLTSSCAVPAPGTSKAGGHQVRIEPLVQVAASGGGIRAAWWTVHVLGLLAGTPCGRHDIFAVSGVSGGSVGTAVLAAEPAGTTHPVAAAEASIETMADPDALASAVDGFMLRDTVAGYTGLDIRAAQMPSTARFPDRAALMQAVWQNQDPQLRAPFPLRHSWLPWTLLFNSTSVTTGCRAILSTVALPHPAAGATANDGLSCGLGASGPSGSYDFFARLRCMRNISTATAAMLSARFTYITPSGTLDGCGGQRSAFADQLVDGGYGDASGLSTLINLAPALLARVREFNTRAIAGAGSGGPVTVVVPVTVYLGNSVQPARTIVVPSRTPEITVPTTALSAGPATELTSTDAMLQLAGATTAGSAWLTCGAEDVACAQAHAIAQAAVPNPLIMIAPTEFPGVAAPLGWLLSKASQNALEDALQRDSDPQTKACGAYKARYLTKRPYCLPGVGGLLDLLRLTKRTP